MGAFIQQTDLENALSPAVVLALFDDASAGAASDSAMADVIASAEAEMQSYLPNVYGTPLPAAVFTDPLLKLACIDFAVVFAYERHPEYVRSTGETSKLETRWKRAKERMERIQEAMQRAITVEPVAKPADVGGVTIDGSSRIILDDADGTSNAGDF